MSRAKTRKPRRKTKSPSGRPRKVKPVQRPATPDAIPVIQAAPAGPLMLRATAITHRGKVRPHNEDCIGVCEWSRRQPMISPVVVECLLDEPRLCVVADGLGGHAGGELASLLGVRRLIQAASGLKSKEAVIAALGEANKLMYEAMDENPDLRSMGATAVGLAADHTQAWLFNVGDSRGYAYSDGKLRLISTDDTTEPRAAPEERTGQRQHSITQCLGGQLFYDDIEPHIVPRTLAPGDRYLLCSDGLTDMLDMAGIERCLQADAVASVEKLLEMALAEGGLDNVSIIIVDILAKRPA